MNEMHYLITVQWTAANGGQNVATHSDVISVAGRTRRQLYEAIFAHVTGQQGAPPQRTSVEFFSLEPNTIGGSAA
jgi:hypothetical protein